MAKFQEALNRIQKNIFVCKKCKTRQRTTMQKILQGKITCKNCGSKAFRPIKKK